MAKLAPTIRLNSGYDMPVIGLGTFKVTASILENCHISLKNLKHELKFVLFPGQASRETIR